MTTDETINVSYAIYDKNGSFSKIAGTAMLSLLHNTKSAVCIHLLHDNTLTAENRNKFIKLIRSYGQEISFYNVEELLPGIFEQFPDSVRFSKAALYRLSLNKILPKEIEKIIYLDADTIVTCDISELWNEEIGANGFAVVPEMAIYYGRMVNNAIYDDGYVDKNRYFNSGVLLIDLNKFKTFPNLLTDGLKLLRDHPDWPYYDQDILNYYFAKDSRLLPVRYNLFSALERAYGNYDIKKGIYHYADMNIDIFGAGDPFNREWFRYFIKTPWFDEDMLLNIFSMTRSQDNFRRKFLRDLFNAAGSKRRVFVGYAEDEPAVRALFNIKAKERYISVAKRVALPPPIRLRKRWLPS